jgi:hypothetical protein
MEYIQTTIIILSITIISSIAGKVELQVPYTNKTNRYLPPGTGGSFGIANSCVQLCSSQTYVPTAAFTTFDIAKFCAA